MDIKERTKDIIKLYNNGDTYQQIADRYGISRQRVHQLISKLQSGKHTQRIKIEA